MTRHNSSGVSKRRRVAVPSTSPAEGERWAYSMEAVVLLWAGSAAVGVMVGALVWLVWR